MNIMADIQAVPAPRPSRSDFLSYGSEARAALAPLVENLLDRAAAAGLSRHTAAIAVMLFAAAQAATSEATAPLTTRPSSVMQDEAHP